MLSLASDADMPATFEEEEVDELACSVVDAAGEEGGDGTLGFQVAKPAGFGRGAGAGPEGAADADFSNAAILSRSEPTLGFGGVEG